MEYRYRTNGVCSSEMIFNIDDNNVIQDDLNITETETDPTMVKTTTEFDKMDYADRKSVV